MHRFIDSAMIGSDRVDERVRLITRVCDTLAPVVGDLGRDTPELIREALLGAMRAQHGRPLDVVADVLGRLSAATGTPWRCAAGLAPGGVLTLSACDGHGVSDYALGATVGVDRDEVACVRDQARLVVGLPPAPPACTRRHAELADGACVTCMLVRADTATARTRVHEEGVVVGGRVLDRVVAHAQQWQADMLRPRLHAVLDGPSPWTAVAGLAV